MKVKICTILASFLSSLLIATHMAAAIDNCGPTPPNYNKHQYGKTLYSLDTPCQSTFSPKEQVFVAGISQGLLSNCGFPKDLKSRLKLQKFLTSSTLVGTIGSQYGNRDLRITLGDQAASGAAFSAGVVTAEKIGCTEAGNQLANNVVSYLDRTAEGAPDKPNYIDGCAKYYSGRYTKQQCRCIADIGRSVFPNIHETKFSPSSIKSMIRSNPFVGLQVALQCQIGDY